MFSAATVGADGEGLAIAVRCRWGEERERKRMGMDAPIASRGWSYNLW